MLLSDILSVPLTFSPLLPFNPLIPSAPCQTGEKPKQEVNKTAGNDETPLLAVDDIIFTRRQERQTALPWNLTGGRRNNKLLILLTTRRRSVDVLESKPRFPSYSSVVILSSDLPALPGGP